MNVMVGLLTVKAEQHHLRLGSSLEWLVTRTSKGKYYGPTRIRSPNFSIFMHAWKGNCSSLPLITILGKSSRCTSKGSIKLMISRYLRQSDASADIPNMPFRVTMTCFGCSSTGSDRTRAATSSAVFHFANCPKRFWPAQTLVWMTLRNNCPERGLKIKMAPSEVVVSVEDKTNKKAKDVLIGLVVKLPSNVLCLKHRWAMNGLSDCIHT